MNTGILSHLSEPVVKLPEAQAQVAVVTCEEVDEARLQVSHVVRGELADKVGEQVRRCTTAMEGGEAASSVAGEDQASGVARSSFQPQPASGAEATRRIDQHRVVGADPRGEPLLDRPPPVAARARWNHQNDLVLKRARESLEQGGLAAALGPDNRRAATHGVELRRQLLERCPGSSKGKGVDTVAGEGVVGRTDPLTL